MPHHKKHDAVEKYNKLSIARGVCSIVVQQEDVNKKDYWEY